MLFNPSYPFFKGNTHAHTTLSDGMKTLKEAIALYAEAGYDFLALTDHDVQSAGDDKTSPLLLSGIELDCQINTQAYHIIGIGMKEKIAPHRKLPQQIIDAIRQAGGRAILAHPAWSLLRVEDARNLKGLTGAEILNSVSRLPWNPDRGDSRMFFDLMAAEGAYLRSVAADDSHFYQGEHCRAYIMVNARELTRDALLEALDAGRFYATEGPRFEQAYIENGKMHITSSPANMAIFYSNAHYNADRICQADRATEFVYPIGPEDTFVRCEIVDANGKKAWLSPIAL